MDDATPRPPTVRSIGGGTLAVLPVTTKPELVIFSPLDKAMEAECNTLNPLYRLWQISWRPGDMVRKGLGLTLVVMLLPD